MRIILFFDLPMVTKKDIKIYTRFRKQLIQEGYIMMQFSVYCKLFANRESANQHLLRIRKDMPKNGQVRAMLVTEKQYARIEILTGDISKQEAITKVEGMLVL